MSLHLCIYNHPCGSTDTNPKENKIKRCGKKQSNPTTVVRNNHFTRPDAGLQWKDQDGNMLRNLRRRMTIDVFRSRFCHLCWVKYFRLWLKAFSAVLLGDWPRLSTYKQITRLSRGNVFAPLPPSNLAASHSSAFLPERALALFSCQARQPRALIRCVLWHVSSQTEQWVGPRGRLKRGGRTFLEQNSWYNKYWNHTHKWRPSEYHFSSMLKNKTKLNVPLLNSFFFC